MKWTTTSELARIVVAVMLFGGWPTRWPLAQRCRVGGGVAFSFGLDDL